MWKRTLVALSFVFSIFFTSCGIAPSNLNSPDDDGDGAGATATVILSLPGHAAFSDAQRKMLTAYRLTITKDKGTCPGFKAVDKSAPWPDFTVEHVTVGCSYFVTVDIGTATSAGNPNPVVYASSATGQTLDLTKVAPQGEVSLVLELGLTWQGNEGGFPKMTGGDANPRPTPTPTVAPPPPTPTPTVSPTPTPTPTPEASPTAEPVPQNGSIVLKVGTIFDQGDTNFCWAYSAFHTLRTYYENLKGEDATSKAWRDALQKINDPTKFRAYLESHDESPFSPDNGGDPQSLIDAFIEDNNLPAGTWTAYSPSDYGAGIRAERARSLGLTYNTPDVSKPRTEILKIIEERLRWHIPSVYCNPPHCMMIYGADWKNGTVSAWHIGDSSPSSTYTKAYNSVKGDLDLIVTLPQ